VKLKEIRPEQYARQVLPLTAPLWAGRRTFEQYVAQTLEMAAGGYGRRNYRTIGLYDGAKLVASFKRYERVLRSGSRRLRAVGFGAVFTPPEYRNRGYASVMLASALDGARNDGCDVAYLFSDIRPQFYAELGFRALPSRELVLRADALPWQRLPIAALTPDDWTGVRRCFELTERSRESAFVRSVLVWEWIATRMRHASEHASGHATNLVVRRGRSVRAYVFGVRVPERDTYDLDEYGFAGDGDAATIPALLRAAAGDLRRIAGWLPPENARALLPKGTTRRRKRAIFMMMALRAEHEPLIAAIASAKRGDFCWASDHI